MFRLWGRVAVGLLAAAATAIPASASVAQQEPVVRVADSSVVEGNATVDSFFDVFLEIDPRFLYPVSVDYRTVDGTARAGSDYEATSGTLTFQQGERQKRVLVRILGDTQFEPDETLSLVLSNLQPGGRFERQEAQLTIRNDDPPVVVLCRCQRVRASLGKGKFFAKDTGPQVYFTYRFPVRWAITCRKGDEPDCRGEVRASTTTKDVEIRDARGKPARGKAISCRGEKCDFTTIGSEEIQVRVTGSKKRKGLFLKKKVVKVHLDRRCLPGGAVARTTATIVFNGSTFNAKESDLNGNGTPDGKD